MSRRVDLLIPTLAIALAMLTGCGRWAGTPAIVMGHYDDRPNEQLFNAALDGARAQGYAPTDVDPSHGRFTVPANTVVTGRRISYSATFTVQCYREGWVRVVPGGTAVRARGDSYVVVTPVKRELETFALRLRESIEGGAHAIR